MIKRINVEKTLKRIEGISFEQKQELFAGLKTMLKTEAQEKIQSLYDIVGGNAGTATFKYETKSCGPAVKIEEPALDEGQKSESEEL